MLATLTLAAGLSACDAPSLVDRDAPVGRAASAAIDSGEHAPLSVVLIMTDDLRADMMWPLRAVDERLVDQGLLFERAYVNTPLCCPARASVAAGGWLARNTGVLTNNPPNGGNPRFDDSDALAVRLQGAGYQTAQIGKYLHETRRRHVPPGWDRWVHPLIELDWTRYDVAVGSSGTAASTASVATVDQYLGSYLTDQALDFLDDAGDEPFFLWLNHWAPHYPATPAIGDEDFFAGRTFRTPAHNEGDVSDKPAHFDDVSLLSDDLVADLDELYPLMLGSLIEVDRSVTAIVDHLEASGRIDDTVVIFTSDNGLQLGEHRLRYKSAPYEGSVKVPLVVRAPGGATGTDHRLVSVTTDVPATVLELAGLTDDGDGASLAPLIGGDALPDWRQELFLESYDGSVLPTWAGVVTPRWKYIEAVGGGVELYDLRRDPYELDSVHDVPALAGVRARLAEWLDGQRGIALVTEQVSFEVDDAAVVALEAWGGTEPYSFVHTSPLPSGLSLSSDGFISGTPTEVGSHRVQVRVTGAAARGYDGGLEDHTAGVEIVVASTLTGPPGPSGEGAVPPEPSVAFPSPGELELRVRTRGVSSVTAALSPNGDFDDGELVHAEGPDARLRFAGLTPGQRYELRIEGPGGVQHHSVTMPR